MPRSISPLAFVFCLFLPASAFAAPLAHWPFEEPSGTTVIDTTGNGHDGLLVGGVERADGASGLGLRFPGAGDAVEVASFGPLGPLHQLSISVWARQLDRGDFTAIVDARDTPQDGYDLFFSNNGRLFMRVNTSILEGPTFIADDAWHHLVGVWDGMSLTLYVDGTLDASTTIPVTTVD
ncbi:MAG: LamG domain-containing protein, partial [Acidobacteriota bacterium]